MCNSRSPAVFGVGAPVILAALALLMIAFFLILERRSAKSGRFQDKSVAPVRSKSLPNRDDPRTTYRTGIHP